MMYFNPLNAELNPICHLLALLGAHHILHVSRVRVKLQGQNSIFSVYLSNKHSFVEIKIDLTCSYIYIFIIF